MGRRPNLFSQRSMKSMEKHPLYSGVCLLIPGIIILALSCILCLDFPLFFVFFLFLSGFFILFGLGLILHALRDKKRQKEKLELIVHSNIYEIDNMDGRTFEIYLKSIYTALGYKVSLTKTTGDYGADLIMKKDYLSTAVQAKHSKNKIGISAVQEIIGAKGHYQTSRAIVVTNNYFTAPAKNLAASNGIELVDRDKLAALMCEVKKLESTTTPNVA